MPKKILEDIKSKGVKITEISRSDIVARASGKKTTRVNLQNRDDLMKTNSVSMRDKDHKLGGVPKIKKDQTAVRRSFMWLLIIAMLLAAIYFIANYYETTKITIKEKTTNMPINQETFTAGLSPGAPIHSELMIVEDTETIDSTFTNSVDVSTKATGEITLFNSYSTKSQNLAWHTFVSDQSGKAYQLDKAVTIPGYTTSNGKIIPGQTSIGITSFLAGDAYNGSPSNFSINLFKGTAKAGKIYGTLKTPLSGGAQGTVYKPTPENIGMLNAQAESVFKSNLLKKADAEVPDGYIFYPSAFTFSYKIPDNILSKTSDAKVPIDGSISLFIIKKTDLSTALVHKLLPNITPIEENEIQIPALESLAFSFASANQSITKDVTSFPFDLTGNVGFIWQQDTKKLKNSLVGVPKYDLGRIFKQDPGIDYASAKIFPPWQIYLPGDSSKIKINIE